MEALPDLTLFQESLSSYTSVKTKQQFSHYSKRHHPYGRGLNYGVPQLEPSQQLPDVSKLMGSAFNSNVDFNTTQYPTSTCYYSNYIDYMYPIYYTNYPQYYSPICSDYIYNDTAATVESKQLPACSFINYIPLNDVTFNTDMFTSNFLQDTNTDGLSRYDQGITQHYRNIEETIKKDQLAMFKPHKADVEVSTKVGRSGYKQYTMPQTPYSVIKSSNGNKYQCTVCQKQYTTLDTINEHCKTCSVEIRPYKCDFCGKLFKSSCTLRVHRRVHTGYKPYQCKYCNLFFSDNSTKTKHERIHTKNKPYQCNVCRIRFTQSGNLRRHMRNIHKLN